jgi:hypothetical protein
MQADIDKVVLGLPRETILEAATFVAEGLAPEADPESEATWLGEHPFTHMDDVDALGRLVLIARALDGPDGATEVETAVEGSGRKNLVLGGAEIVALAGLGVIALRILVTKGRLTDETIEMRQDPKTRNWSVVVKRIEKPITISNELAAVFQSFFPGSGPVPPV